jgi:uncharacterized membrane protein YeaQ/YmgE (transglycosylase-associated protein family)
MDVIGLLIIGFVVGALARFFLPGRDPIGCLPTILLGVLGALIGERLWEELFGRDRGVAWIGSILVAMLLLAAFRRFTYRRPFGPYRRF